VPFILATGRLLRFFDDVITSIQVLPSATSSVIAIDKMSSAPFLPPHHDPKGGFRNPTEWGSYQDHGPLEYLLKVAPRNRKMDLFPVPTAQPDAGLITNPKEDLQVTWLGHASLLIQAGGVNMITDPVFSQRCSPVQFAGPSRYTPPPCKIEELPPIHVVLISHNHYDHVDSGSIASLAKKEESDLAKVGALFQGTLWVCPLGLKPNLVSCGAPAEKVVELDWWDTLVPASVSVGSYVAVNPLASLGSLLKAPKDHHDYSAANLAAAETVDLSKAALLARSGGASIDAGAAKSLPRIICIPAQHQSARSGFDRNKTLWCGYVVATPTKDGSSLTKFLFTGDTAYRWVPEGVAPLSPEEDAAVSTPSFKFVGKRYGPIDIAALPTGAYSPRWFMSSVHTSPSDAVEIHKDIRSKRSVAIHWGSFPLTDEPIMEPVTELDAALKHKGLIARIGPEEEVFVTVYPGATVGAKAGVFDKRLIARPGSVDIPKKA
jgi:N-acyl-phosphatidylethanolamine-hydrolysing phospholipase D